MTTPKTAPAPVVEDQPPWEEPTPAVPARLPNPEATWVAWWNFAIPVEQYDFENETDYVEYVPLSVTVRDGEPVTNLFEQVAEFAKMALLNGWKPISEKNWTAMDVANPPKPAFAPVAPASSPLPAAAQPGQTWTPPQQQVVQPWTPPQGAPAQQPQQQANAGDNTFIVDKLFVAFKTTTKGETYKELRLKGPRYHTWGVRIWDDKLDAVLPGWSGADPGEWDLPNKYKATFSWDEKPSQDGSPRPKNVYALELVS